MSRWPTLRHGPVVPQIERMLREHLRRGGWAVGERVPSEAALAVELGVGRSSIREAIRLLSRDGLLEVRHGSGTYVAADPPLEQESVAELMRRARLLEVYEVRRSLEVEAARLAAQRAPADGIPALRAQLRDRAAHADDPARFVAVDLEFHEAVVRLADNALLTRLYTTARPVIEAALVERISHDGPLLDVDDAHDDLLTAIADHDEAAAIEATVANLERTMQQLRADAAREADR